jgi:lysophospholipase L1-like esterase
MMTIRLAAVATAVYLLATGTATVAQRGRADHWVGTWATAAVARPPAPAGGAQGRGPAPPLNFNNQTLRQVVHVSLGGSRVRVVLSNAFGTLPLAVGAASVALRQKDSAIVGGSSRPLMFGGNAATIVAGGAIAVSDPVSLAVPALTDLAIDVFLPGDTAASTSPLTTHNGALQTNYVSTTGNHVGAVELPVSATTQSWFFLSSVDVTGPQTAGAVVALGDSITDGTLSTPDTNNRWPDHLARRLMAGRGGTPRPTGVLNQGIAGNRVLSDFVGPSALARFDRDVLAQSGVTHVILLEGLNDLGLGGNGQPIPSAADVIAGYRQVLARAHTHGIKVIAGTMLPFEGADLGAIAPGYYSPEKNSRRQAINEFIRSGGGFDGVIDFEAAVRDPGHPLRLLARFKGADNLHLNDAGYQAMAEAVNLALLR